MKAVKTSPESEQRMKAAKTEAPSGLPETLTFATEDIKIWKEWLDAHEGELLSLFTAIEELTDQANAGARLFNERYCPENVHDRYDEAEDNRNHALKMVRWIAQAEKQIAEALGKKLHDAYVPRKDGDHDA